MKNEFVAEHTYFKKNVKTCTLGIFFSKVCLIYFDLQFKFTV
jgi:hypothetical protein